MQLPPPPPGREEVGYAPKADAAGRNLLAANRPGDPLHSLLGAGVQVTNGFRTPADTARIRAQGYKPAKNSLHLQGDAIDLTPGKSGWSMNKLGAMARKTFGPNAKIINEGHHIHVQVPGWGGALPAPPEGFELAEEDGGLPPPPPGYEDADAPAASPPTDATADRQPTVEELTVGRGYQSAVDPAKNAQLQAAFDKGAPLKQLLGMAKTLGIEFEHGNTGPLRAAIAFRDKGGKGARIVPEKVETKPLPGTEMKALTTPDEPFGKTIPERFGNLARSFGEMIGHPFANRMESEAQTAAEWLPVIGGASAIEQAGTDLEQGRYGSAAINAGLGSLDFIPAIGPVGRAVGRAGKQVIDNTALRSVASGAEGVDMAKAGEYLRSTADEALRSGGQVTLHVEGRAIPITQPGLVDEAGQPWGAMPILSPAKGDNPRLEISFPEGAPIASANAPEAGAVRASEDDVPPPPEGYASADEPEIGRARPMQERRSAEDVAAAAEQVNPEDVTPIPANWVESPEELPSTLRTIEGPGSPGRTPKRPARFSERLRERLAKESAQTGIPVRIDAEDAISNGVPAELIYKNPNVVDKAQLQLRNPSLFGTRYGRMSSNQQVLRSLDMDSVDPVEWGFDNLAGQRLGPEEIGDLLRRDLEGDPSALQRGGAYDAWTAHQARAASKAEFEGRYPHGPPVERVGEPALPPEPPVTAYEDLPKVGGKVGNINLDNVQSQDDIRRVLQSTEAKIGGFDSARRGKVSQAETAELASELKMTPDDLLRRRNGQALNAEQALAARRILAKSADELVKLARKAQGGSDEDLTNFRKAWVRHAAIQEQVTGATAEAGRALSQFRMLASAGDARVQVMKGLIESTGGREGIEKIAQSIIDLEKDPAKLNSFTRQALKPKLKDKLVELWYNSLLSGPQTHVVNMVSNTFTSLAQLPEHALAAGIGSVRYKATKAAADRVLFSEVGARAVGWLHGAQDGIQQAVRTFRTGEASDFVDKVEQHAQKAISGRKGEILRIPTRMLSAEDEFFKAIARQMEIGGLAVRKAAAEGLKGDAARQRAAELVANPTDDMLERAFDYGRYVTFQTELGSIGKLGLKALSTVPALKLIVPFLRTPSNLFKFAIERSPAAPLVKRWRDDFKSGGAQRDLAVARAMIGSAVGAMFVQWAADGHVTGGGPLDENATRIMRADGWQPYSIKVGDTYYSYARLDPFATAFGIAADFATKSEYMTKKQQEHVAALVGVSIMQQLQSKTWLSGLSDVVEAVNDPQRAAPAWLARLAGSIAVPTGVAQIARTKDPVLREARGVLDRIKSRVPGLSETLPGRVNIWGQPIVSEGGLGPDIASPIWVGTRKNDPVTQEVLAIGARMGAPRRQVAGVELTDSQFAEYSALSGRYMYEDIKAAMDDPSWWDMEPWERAKEVESIKADARAEAREELFPELLEQAEENTDRD